MVRIKQYQQQVEAKPVAHEYLKADTQGAFGEQLANAYVSLGESVQNVQHAVLRYNDQQNRTKALELSNELYRWEEEKLHSKDGYYNQFGRNASGKAQAYIDDFDNYARTKAKELGLDGLGSQQYVEFVINQRKEKISRGIMAHDLKQTQEAEKNEAGLLLQNLQNSAIEYRNNDFELDKNLNDIKKASNIYGKTSNLDETQIQLLQLGNVSDTLAKVINSSLSEGSLRAGELYEKYKDQLTPDMKVKLGDAVNNLNNKYNARNIADRLFMSSVNEEEALQKAEAIDDIDLSDSVAQRLRQKYSQKRRLEEQQQADLINNYIDNAVQKIKNGEQITEDDIPQGLDGRHYLQAKSQIEHLNQYGEAITDEHTYAQLWYTASYDAQRFKNMNLSLYRLSLSQKDYEALLKRQQQISKNDYYTTLINSGTTKKLIEEITGAKGNDELKTYEQYQKMLREHEQNTGREANSLEKEQFLKYLGSDENNYKKIERVLKDNADFNRELDNHIRYYQSRHNGDMPDVETFNKWVKEQSIQYKKGKYQAIRENAIKNTKRVANEQITLTDFADNYVPALSNKIGANLNVTSRYRSPNGKYTSRHSEGRALDIGYITKDGKNLTTKQKAEMIANVLREPRVEKIAISSKGDDGKAVFEQLRKNLGIKDKQLWEKIQDMNMKDGNGKTRDENLGTNHTNHLHITLYKDKTYNGNDIIAIKNQLKNNGYSETEINSYLKSKGII